MSTKERILEAVRQMPEIVSFEEILERLVLIEELKAAVTQIDAREGISYEEAKRRILAM